MNLYVEKKSKEITSVDKINGDTAAEEGNEKPKFLDKIFTLSQRGKEKDPSSTEKEKSHLLVKRDFFVRTK